MFDSYVKKQNFLISNGFFDSRSYFGFGIQFEKKKVKTSSSLSKTRTHRRSNSGKHEYSRQNSKEFSRDFKKENPKEKSVSTVFSTNSSQISTTKSVLLNNFPTKRSNNHLKPKNHQPTQSESTEKIRRILERAELSIEKAKRVRDLSIGRNSGSKDRIPKSKTCTNSPQNLKGTGNKENRNKVSSYLFELRRKLNGNSQGIRV